MGILFMILTSTLGMFLIMNKADNQAAAMLAGSYIKEGGDPSDAIYNYRRSRSVISSAIFVFSSVPFSLSIWTRGEYKSASVFYC